MKWLVVILFSSFSLFLRAHEYYFAFAETEYNQLTGRLETTLTVSTHDMEKLLLKKSGISKELEHCQSDTSMQKLLEQLITEGFFFHQEGKGIQVHLEGMEVLLNGLTNFYLTSEVVEDHHSFSVQFGLFMDIFPEQQNKLTFIFQNQKRTFVFLPQSKDQTFMLNEL